eukprot:5324456-Pleurochrysis_carterae.AAC.1
MPTAAGRHNAHQGEHQLSLGFAAAAGLLSTCATVSVTSVAAVATPHLSEPAAPSPSPLVNRPAAYPPPASTSTPVPSPSRPRRPRGR